METYTVIVDQKGTIRWYQNDKVHRLDGPAVEWVSGTKKWFQNGKLHRLDGPACEWVGGSKEWWIDGEQYTKEEFDQKVRPCAGKKVTVDGIEYTLS